MKKIFLIVILLILFSAVGAHAGKVVLSTYYPAPFGSYDRMKLVPRAALADTYCEDRPSNASMYYTENRGDGPDSVRYCLKDESGNQDWVPYPGVWTQNSSNNVYLTDSIIEDGSVINPNLKVGIGTTAPVSVLEIKKTSATLNEPMLRVYANDTGQSSFVDDLIYGYVHRGNSNTYNLLKLDNFYGTIMKVAGNGNVTIKNDINDFASIMHKYNTNVGGFAALQDLYSLSDDAGNSKIAAKIQVTKADNSSASFGANLSFDTGYNNAYYTRLMIQSNGNVGIGTTAPDERLAVYGNISFGWTSARRITLKEVTALDTVSCDTQCGNFYCLGAYVYGSTTKQTCSATVGNNECICIGR